MFSKRVSHTYELFILKICEIIYYIPRSFLLGHKNLLFVFPQVVLIAQSMDTVEREFEVRDKHIANLEAMLAKAESDLATANDVIKGQRMEIVQAMSTQKTLLMQYHESEIESKELHEFLQAEKYTLAGKF